MKISKDVVIALVKEVRAIAEEEAEETDNGILSVYFLDDIVLTFHNEGKGFYGLVFEALGRDFTVLSDLEIVVSIAGPEGEDDAYQVEDKAFVSQLETYLSWRTEILKNFEL